MLYSKILVLVSCTLLLSPVFAMEGLESDSSSQKRNRSTSPTQPQVRFASAWEKVKAHAQARIRENEITLNRLRENPEEEVKVWYPSVPTVRKAVASSLQNPTLRNEFHKSLEEDIKFFNSLIKNQLRLFSHAVDDLLLSLYTEKLKIQQYLTTRPLSVLEQDDRNFYNYAINKLKPFQFGWFDYIEASITPHNKNGTVKVDGQKMNTLYIKNTQKFTSEDWPKIAKAYQLNSSVTRKVIDSINSSFNDLVKNRPPANLAHTIEKSLDDSLSELKPVAQAFAKSSALFRLYTTPSIIKNLKETDLSRKSTAEDTPREDKSETIPTAVQEKKLEAMETESPNSQLQNEPAPSFFSLPQESIETIEPNTSTTAINLEEKPTKPKRLTVLQQRQQRKEERKEQQRRAREWCQKIFEEHRVKGDYESQREWASQFKWITDLANPDITMTYQSIKAKLENLVQIKNGAGARRHFFIRHTPVDKPTACYFHEPHPDEAVRIEKWRENIVEAFKEAGYLKLAK